MIIAQRIASVPRPLQWIAVFLVGLGVWVPVLIFALSYAVTSEQDYRNAQRIESEKAQMCAKTPGIADCTNLPKTNHWRN